jgi:hypothetical protein
LIDLETTNGLGVQQFVEDHDTPKRPLFAQTHGPADSDRRRFGRALGCSERLFKARGCAVYEGVAESGRSFVLLRQRGEDPGGEPAVPGADFHDPWSRRTD